MFALQEGSLKAKTRVSKPPFTFDSIEWKLAHLVLCFTLTAASGKSSSKRHSVVSSLYSQSQVTDTTGSLGEDEFAFGENTTTASNATVPHSKPRAPQSDMRPGAFHDDGRNARDVTVNEEWSNTVHQSDQSASQHSEPDVLVSAHTVDPNETQRLVERELAEQRRNAPVAELVKGYWCSPRVKRLCIVGGMLVIVVVVLGTVLGTVLPQEPTPAPTPAPTPVEPYLIDEISSRSPDGGEALQTESTPQSDAFNWLVNNSNLVMYPLEKKIQRYVLATLYFSTNGNNWRSNRLWLSDDDECGWYNEATGSFCIDSKLVDLDLYSCQSLSDDTSGNNLVGTIPNEISLLSDSLGECLNKMMAFQTLGKSFSLTFSYTEDLQLAGNTLMGTIPSEIGALSKLSEFCCTESITFVLCREP